MKKFLDSDDRIFCNRSRLFCGHSHYQRNLLRGAGLPDGRERGGGPFLRRRKARPTSARSQRRYPKT